MTPKTLYARIGEAFVAYQVFGEGPIDVVFDVGWIGNVEAQWDYPALARFLNRLGSFSRVICLDHRGHGLSDPVDTDDMTLEQWMEDVRVVMEATSSERAALVAAPEGGPMAILHAATYPERTSALVLINVAATKLRHDDYPWGMPPMTAEKYVNEWQKCYLDEESAALMIGSIVADEQDLQHMLRLARFAQTPGRAKKLAQVNLDLDVRNVLLSVRVPTIIIHRTENLNVRIGHGRYLAQQIANAKYVELPGREHWPWSGDQDAILDEIEEFLTGVRPALEADRVLATVLFTDVVASTEHAKALGDRRWTAVLDQHDAVALRELNRHRGRKVNPTGDGLLATFDGPARAVRCAQAICSAVRPLGIEIRAGLHTGEIELRGSDIGGIAVHIGQRVSALAGPGEVLVSRTVTDLVAGSGLEFDDRGEHDLKGAGKWALVRGARVTVVPVTQYAPTSDGYVAYQVIGDGPIDLVHVSSWISDVEAQWEYPALARFLERLASFSRLICFDRRGHGMSDPIDPDDLTLDQWMEDIQAVMDEARSDRAALFASAEGGHMGMMYAATHPERTSALVLVNARATGMRHPDYPWGMPESAVERAADLMERSYAKDPTLERDVFSNLTSDERDREMLWRLARRSTSPKMTARLWRVSIAMDVRNALAAVRVPTLVVQRRDNQYTRVGHGRYLAEHIANAKYVELPGLDHFPWSGDQDQILDEIEEFLTGVRPVHDTDRVLASVLFTDIVGSTERAASLGDRRWGDVLTTHDDEVTKQLKRFDGRKISSVGRGDGVLATFDGPARAVRCARSIVDAAGSLGIEVRAGVHIGEIERRGADVGGIAVHIADRIASLARPSEVLVSRTVVDLVVGSDLTFEDRGSHPLKGVPNEWQLYAVAR